MTLFTYEIAAPTNVIEASASPEPDDVSLAYIRIEAVANQDIKEGDIDEIRFEINVSPEPQASETEGEEDENKGLLTRNPGNITPVAAAFETWTFSAPEEGDIFYARPDAPQKNTDSTGTEEGDTEGNETGKVLVSAKQRLVFYLYDIEVIDRDGITLIEVTEVDGAGNKDDTHPDLEIRKIFPALRIDFFTTDKLSVQAGTKVDLNWATTSATEIWLTGISEADRANDDNPPSTEITTMTDTYRIWERLPQPDSTEISQQEGVAQKDGVYFVRPETTTTYTLRARSNKADTLAIRQLTIAVTDQIVTPKVDAATVDADMLMIGGEKSIRSPHNLRAIWGHIRIGVENEKVIYWGAGYTLERIRLAAQKTKFPLRYSIKFDESFDSTPYMNVNVHADEHDNQYVNFYEISQWRGWINVGIKNEAREKPQVFVIIFIAIGPIGPEQIFNKEIEEEAE